VRRGQLTGADLDTLDLLDGGGDFRSGSAVTLRLGPDGHMYYASSGQGASTGGNDPIRRIRFSASTPPVADFATLPDPATGAAPLQVQFTDLSTAPGSSISARNWMFGDGGSATSASPQHIYTEPGRYTATLRITNAAGQQDSHSAPVTVTRRVSLDLQGLLRDARSLIAPALGVATELRFYQDDGVTPALVVGAGDNVLEIPAGGVVDEQIQLDLSGNALVISAGEPAGDAMQTIRRGYLLPAGSGPHALDVDAWLSDTAIAGTVHDTRGEPLAVDIGLRLNGTAHALPHGRDYLPGGPPATGIDHRVESDALGYFHMALRSADAGSVQLDAVADTGTATHANPQTDASLAAGSLLSAELVVGIWDGGRDCSDLSAIGTTPAVSFAADLQPIFNAACIGCHAPAATNSGGLDLTSAASFAALVDAFSGRAPGVKRVAIGDPSRSFLFEKINCNDPQRGTRMRPADPMPASQQALFRDWILQLEDPLRIFYSGFE
jgi:PKD repeat protein